MQYTKVAINKWNIPLIICVWYRLSIILHHTKKEEVKTLEIEKSKNKSTDKLSSSNYKQVGS
jgi:hypothetical protein